MKTRFGSGGLLYLILVALPVGCTLSAPSDSELRGGSTQNSGGVKVPAAGAKGILELSGGTGGQWIQSTTGGSDLLLNGGVSGSSGAAGAVPLDS